MPVIHLGGSEEELRCEVVSIIYFDMHNIYARFLLGVHPKDLDTTVAVSLSRGWNEDTSANVAPDQTGQHIKIRTILRQEAIAIT